MQTRRFWAAAGIIAIIIIGGFALSVPHTRDFGQIARVPQPATSTPAVAYTDTYRRGTHAISGTVLAPDACTTVTASATTTAAASSTAIALSIEIPLDSGVCLQLPTKIPFSATVSAPKNAPITVTVNGTVATTTAS